MLPCPLAISLLVSILYFANHMTGVGSLTTVASRSSRLPEGPPSTAGDTIGMQSDRPPSRTLCMHTSDGPEKPPGGRPFAPTTLSPHGLGWTLSIQSPRLQLLSSSKQTPALPLSASESQLTSSPSLALDGHRTAPSLPSSGGQPPSPASLSSEGYQPAPPPSSSELQPPAPPSSSSGGKLPAPPPSSSELQPPVPPSSSSGGNLPAPPPSSSELQPPAPPSSSSGGKLPAPPPSSSELQPPAPPSSSSGGKLPAPPPSSSELQPPAPPSSSSGGKLPAPPPSSSELQPPAPPSSSSGGKLPAPPPPFCSGQPSEPPSIGQTPIVSSVNITSTRNPSAITKRPCPINFLLSSLQRNCSSLSVLTDESLGPTWDSEIRHLLTRVFSRVHFDKYSCKNRCGKYERDSPFAVTSSRHRCFCDNLCDTFGDCCYDFDALCKQIVKPHLRPLSLKESCRALDVGTQVYVPYSGVRVWSNCPVEWKDKAVGHKCQEDDPRDLLDNIPVFDKKSNQTYRNIFCATCNGAKNTTYWQLKVTCNSAFNLTSYDILELQEKGCTLEIFPDHHQLQDLKLCIPRFQDCLKVTQAKKDTYCQNECSRYAFPVCHDTLHSKQGRVRFRNVQCALCNGRKLHDLQGECLYLSGPISPALTILFDFHSTSKYQIQVEGNRGPIKHINKVISCQADEVFDPYLQKCKAIITSDNEWQENNTNSNCSLISFGKNEYVLFSNKSVFLKPHNKIYNNQKYTIRENRLWICVNFPRNGTERVQERLQVEKTGTHVLQLFTSIGGIVSFISLTMLLVTYALFPELRNLPGKIVMNLASCLLIYQLLFFFAVDTSDSTRCVVIAVFLHFFALSSFAWMNIMAFDVHRTFTAAGGGARTQDGQIKRLAKYTVYSFGIPVVIVVATFVVDQVEEGIAVYGRGDQVCFISNSQALLYSFVLPVGILMLLNLVALGNTLKHIIKTRKIARQVTNQRPNSSMMRICVKMVSVMGVTWLLGAAANLPVLWFLWYPFVVLNSLQGFFIFLSFAVSGRALELYKGKLTQALQSRRAVVLPSSLAKTNTRTDDTYL